MNKKLLIDTINFEVSPQQLREASESNDGRLIVQGVLQRATSKNQNGRVYPKDILAREVAQYKKNSTLSVNCKFKTSKNVTFFSR